MDSGEEVSTTILKDHFILSQSFLSTILTTNVQKTICGDLLASGKFASFRIPINEIRTSLSILNCTTQKEGSLKSKNLRTHMAKQTYYSMK